MAVESLNTYNSQVPTYTDTTPTTDTSVGISNQTYSEQVPGSSGSTTDINATIAAADAAAAALSNGSDGIDPTLAAAAATADAAIAPTGSTTAPAATGSTGPAAPSKAALALLQSLFSGYGLTGDIASGLSALAVQGIDGTTISNILMSPDPQSAIQGLGLNPAGVSAVQSLINSWQTRFSGNILRQQAGLNALDPATYISTENSYKAVFAQAGMTNLASDQAYIGKLFGVDVSPAEVQQRVNAAMTAMQAEDPTVIAELRSQFGLTPSQLAMHLLDSNYSSNIIAQQVQASQIAASASEAGSGIGFGNTGPTGLLGANQGLTAMQLAGMGVTQAQAQQGFQSIAQQQAGMQALAARYNNNAGAVGSELQASTFGTTVNGINAAQAQQTLNRLKMQETGQFSGSAGVATGSLKGAEEGIS